MSKIGASLFLLGLRAGRVRNFSVALSSATTTTKMAPPPSTPGQNPWKKAGITGFAVILEMTSGGLFMENVKMEKQRTSESYPRIIRNVLKQGIRGFEAGLWPWGLVLGLTKGTVLGGSKAQLDHMCHNFGMTKKTSDLVSGFGSGAVQGVFMSPILLARTRVNQNLTERSKAGKTQMSVLEEMRISSRILNDAIKKEGVMMLTTGMGACVFKRAMDWGTRFMFINIFRNYLQSTKPAGQGLNDAEKLYTSFIGGAASVTVTQPVDRLMPILQQAGRDTKPITQIIKEKFAAEGITTMQRGWAMRTLHTGYHTMFAIFVADKIYAMLS